ncbi:serine hydrolase domain-containing protein [Luteimonas soli]|uniref:Serine hydrolase domain-containing protein n=1 Tax=Luteimonas soli TaxID=1648966 RepID=A0ABV7XN51_9GAMM
MPVINRRELLAGSLALPFLSLSASGQSRPPSSKPSFESRLRPTVHTGVERWSLAERMSFHAVPGVAVAILRNGDVEVLEGYGSRLAGSTMPVGPDTLFSVGSVSKVATAALCLKLVADGILDLEADVGRWLRRWRIPPGPDGDETGISLRMLLSHTAGFNVHGFKDFDPSAQLPSLVQILTGEPPALNKPLARIDRAGTRSRYSGGGYMVVQAVIEDATGQPFDTVAQRHLFEPLGMTRSRFDATPARDTADIAHAHDESGRPTALPRGWQSFPELAPSGLWASARDLGRLVGALGESYRGRDGFLPRELAFDMMTEVSPGTFGLGLRLAGEGASRIFHHAGANDSYKAYIEGNLLTGDGLVILTNGERGGVLGDEIRNAVSDVLGWPGDWSVRISSTAASELFDGFTGRYARRASQSPVLAGILDTRIEAEELVVSRTAEGLALEADGRLQSLKPVSSHRFVFPDAYVPAGTLQIVFDRGSDRQVAQARLIADDGVLVFDRAGAGST